MKEWKLVGGIYKKKMGQTGQHKFYIYVTLDKKKYRLVAYPNDKHRYKGTKEPYDFNVLMKVDVEPDDDYQDLHQK